MAIFQELLSAIRHEVTENPKPDVVGPGVYSRMRRSNRWYFDCFYSGENIVPFSWHDLAGQQHSDLKIADVCVLKVPRVNGASSQIPALEYRLLASGQIVQLIHETTHREADETTIGFLLGLVTSEFRAGDNDH